MSISERLNNWMIKKITKDKVKYLYMVPKSVLFQRIHDLYEFIEVHGLLEEYEARLGITHVKTEIKVENRVEKLDNSMLLKEVSKLEKDLQQIKEDRKISKTELAYQALVKKCEELQQENKSMKQTLDIAHTALKNTNHQNEFLKDRVKRIESTNEHLEERNKELKASQETKKEIKVVNHNFAKNEHNNTNSRSVNKNIMVTRQVNN